MDDIKVEAKPLLVDRELPGLREAVLQLVVKPTCLSRPCQTGRTRSCKAPWEAGELKAGRERC
ncbi:hypothetical protein CCH79_00008504 [Gambusia affinis]|uniref:Uncharacterized protein n=1 Tax=Gambusia affinis TaxID=33528 RepID=A0A315UUJ4_GAMAF|nr:hypothetical protein CCH79_00008504 [Gambusia affinis]